MVPSRFRFLTKPHQGAIFQNWSPPSTPGKPTDERRFDGQGQGDDCDLVPGSDQGKPPD